METATHSTNGVSHEESVREVEQIRHTNDTITQEDALRAHTEASNIRIVTPNYKTGEKPGSDLKIGASMQELNQRLSSGLSDEADYRAERAQEHFRMQIIDPKVNSNAHLPAHAPYEFARKKLIDDFPSLHGKRSFLNLDAMKQRTMRNSRPLSTSKYLTESLDRHRDTANSVLKEFLKTREEEANKPWNKPGWPQLKKKDLDDLDKLRKSLDSLQKIQLGKEQIYKANSSISCQLGDLRPSPTSLDVLLRRRTARYMNEVARQQLSSPTPLAVWRQRRTQRKLRVVDNLCGQQRCVRAPKSVELRQNQFAKNRLQEEELDYCELSYNTAATSANRDRPVVMPKSQSRSNTTSDTAIAAPFRQHHLSLRSNDDFCCDDSKMMSGNSVVQVRAEEDDEHYNNNAMGTTYYGEEISNDQPLPPPPSFKKHSRSSDDDMLEAKFHQIRITVPPPAPTPQSSYRNGGSGKANDRPSNVVYEDDERVIVVWPPLPSANAATRAPSPKSIYDAECMEELRRQCQQEAEADRHRQRATAEWRRKQEQALAAQRDLLESHQQLKRSPSSVFCNRSSQYLHIFEASHHVENTLVDSYAADAPPAAPPGSRYRARYLVDENGCAEERNEILTSDERLARERVEVDLLARRAAFVEHIAEPPQIRRIGRRWEPPPSPPPFDYCLNARDAIAEAVASDMDAHFWIPFMGDGQAFRRERRNFTPQTSEDDHTAALNRRPPFQTLDEAARRQMLGMIIPLPDGSHRPAPAFRTLRNRVPAGGFVPHAPNAVKITKIHRRRDGRCVSVERQYFQPENSCGSCSPSAVSKQPSPRFSSLIDNAREPKELDDLAELSRNLAERSRSRRAEYRLNAADDIVKTEPEPLPARIKNGSPFSAASFSPQSAATAPPHITVKTEHSDDSLLREFSGKSSAHLLQRHLQQQRYSCPSTTKSLLREAWSSEQSTLQKQVTAKSKWSSRGFVKVNTCSTSSIQEPIHAIVRHEPPPPPPPLPIRREIVEVKREVKPKVTHTVHRVEENRRTEEVERRVVRRERRHKSTRVRHGHYGGGSQQQFHQEHFNNNNDWNTRGLRSSSTTSRNGFGGGSDYHNGYSRGGDGADFVDSRGYGSVGSRDASKHHQQQSKRVHKSYSTRDVLSDAGYGSGAYSSSGGGGGGGYSHHSIGGFYDRHHAAPLVEFPPTLPRHGAANGFYDAPPPHHYYGSGAEGGRLMKSRSYADWDAGRGPFGGAMRRYDDDMARLENEFRDSLLMRVPNGNNMNEKVHRHELIPGGYETYEREVKSSGGVRPSGRDGHPADFNQSSQEFNYKRETQR